LNEAKPTATPSAAQPDGRLSLRVREVSIAG
jgi:hypothetical protein